MTKLKVRLDICIDDRRWRSVPNLSRRLEKTIQATFECLPAKLQIPAAVTLLLTNDATMQRLNQDFRGIKKPTNVLSFPQFEPSRLPKKGRFRDVIHLGDIAL